MAQGDWAACAASITLVHNGFVCVDSVGVSGDDDDVLSTLLSALFDIAIDCSLSIFELK